MGSIYAKSSTSGGSVYAKSGGTPGVASSKGSSKGGGGLLGFLGHAAHVVAQKSDLAAHDIAAIPAGVATITNEAVYQPYKNLVTTGHPYAHGQGQKIDKLTNQAIESSVAPLAHPGRDPFQTILTLLPAAGGAARVGLAADAARTAEGAGVVGRAGKFAREVAKPSFRPRTIKVPKLVAPEGEGPVALAHESVHLQPAKGSLGRLLQVAHDTLIQRSLDRNVSTAEPSTISKYAMRRVGKVTSETARTAQRTSLVLPQMLERVGKLDAGIPKRVGQLALFLRSNQVLPAEAARFWSAQAARGVNPAETGQLAELAQHAHDLGLVAQDATGKIAVDAARYPKLAAADDLLRANQETRAGVIGEHGLMSPEGMKTRLGLVSETMLGTKPMMDRLRVLDQNYETLIRNIMAGEKVQSLRGVAAVQNRGSARVRELNTAPTDQLRGYAEQRLQQAMDAHPDDPAVRRLQAELDEAAQIRHELAAHNDAALEGAPTGRTGEGYTPLKTSVKGFPQSGIARSRPPLIGRTRGFIGGKRATGAGVAKGLVPASTTGGVARAAREALRYEGTVTHRGIVARYGSDVRRTGEDVLIADPAAAKYAAEIPTSTNEILGRSTATLTEADHVGLAQAMKAKIEDAIPGLGDNFARDRQAALGARAPEGYKWVPRQLLGDLVSQTLPRTGVVKRVNDVNSAVTAATVYFKLSHIPQRLTTDATTSAISGALFSPRSLHAAMTLRKALTEREYAEAVAATGTHGYLALPHEGVSAAARAATRGASFYAHRIDSPFRFLNLVHEARVEGLGTPDGIRKLIAYARRPDPGAPDAARLQFILNRSNRVSMMYDGLGSNEQRILARGLWFYPWTKAAVRFAGHTIGEHPLKAAVGVEAGKVGEQQQAKILGDIPSYEYGLLPSGGGAFPSTSDPAILTPFGTAANAAELVARPGGLIGNLNPVASALLTAASGVNQYGDKTTSPIGDALAQLFAPTPEAQILSAHLHPAKPTQIFHKTPLSQLVRSLGGPTVPRKTNKAALNKAAARERSGR